MYCSKCGSQMATKSRYCSSCGHKTRQAASKLLITITILFTLVCITVFALLGSQVKQLFSKTEVATEVVKEEPKEAKVEQTKVEPKQKVTLKKQTIAETPKSISDIINASQPKVFTILTDISQGSGFLINKNGDVLTNAHVVEGSLYPVVKTMDGKELEGTLIGYSNTTDMAVIRVPELANQEPLALETEAAAEIGEEVVALGSPKGFENTATLGNISGVDRTFVIEPFQYNGIYQTSAPIAPGSSGGPLVSKATGKVIAINSARHTEEVNIGFSIPLHQIMETINRWVSSPMTEEDITVLFYHQDGMYYYQDYLDDYGYFEDGEYNEDYFEYYEIPYDESWYEGDYEYWNDSYESEGDSEYWDDSYEPEGDSGYWNDGSEYEDGSEYWDDSYESEEGSGYWNDGSEYEDSHDPEGDDSTGTDVVPEGETVSPTEPGLVEEGGEPIPQDKPIEESNPDSELPSEEIIE